jgi:hypothetical protein
MFHDIMDEFLQECLDEFCYEFSRRYFKNGVFDWLIIAVV